MASNSEAPHEIYPGFFDDVIRNFLFQRQFYQPDGSQQQLSQQNTRQNLAAALTMRTPMKRKKIVLWPIVF